MMRGLVALVLAAGTVGATPQAPPDVDATLTVRLAAGKSTYAVGELIPLELEFRGQAGPDWFFSTVGEGLLLGRERYVATPADGHDDPFAEYLASAGVVGSVLSGWHPLDGTPFVVGARLNDRVRFTKPGDYRLVVESSRLERYSRKPAPALVSNPLALRIRAASPEWAAAELARAVAAVEGGRAEEGAAVLRHLGTEGAAIALVTHYGAGGLPLRFDWSVSLAASPHRQEIVRAMETRVDAGEPLPPGFVRDLAFLRSLLDLPGGSYGPRFERQKAAECDYTRRSISALARNGPSAAGLSAVLVGLEEPPDHGCDANLVRLLEKDPVASREAFLALPARTQALLLEYRWETIRGPWVEPALEALYEGWKGGLRFPGAGDAALRRLAELAPSRGRARAIEEIRTGAHGLVPDTLFSVAEPPVAGLDDALSARFTTAASSEGEAAAMSLVARYGSRRLLPLVLGALDQGAECELEAAAIEYLLEHDRAVAQRRLQPAFARGRGQCASPPWSQLAPRRWDETVEAAVLAHLGSRDDRLVIEAARALEAYGSARVKEPLLARFAAWSAEWREREAELEALAAGPSAFDSPLVLENSLANALLNGRSVALTDDELARVRGLCVTTGCRGNVDAQPRSRGKR
jgi:hypothetical protein